ncbi:Manganese-binding lipoprotein MntA [Tepidimonas thermarum]|uniref:Manganese-binding lipoprotein MntA n=1 Tax=Tepidimonas thermarum TaxID=335431 RepID=A0A554X2G8_9BURK|nr:zinc ABC transporter substrate-binding protein [Tepidimonas thermarum]TSE30041.1 Manganese-binding lipoprotein MntA [Tepidimonas thermarum]
MSQSVGIEGWSRRGLMRWAGGVAVSMLARVSAVRAEGALPVVASFSILADLVRQVGGDRVQVDALVGPEADAHVFQPRPADARRLTAARLVVAHGLGFEGWLERLLRNAAYQGALVRVSDGLPDPLPARGQHGHGGHDHAHVHDHGDWDPHTWQDVRNAMHAVQRIEAALCAADPDGCAHYRQRGADYRARLQALHDDIVAAWQAIEPARRKVVTSHAAFGYYARAYGVTFLAAKGVSTASEPSATTVARLIRLIRAEGVRAVFIERLTDPRLIERIAKEAGVRPSAVPLYSDALSAPAGPAPDYIALMRHNTQALVAAIRSGA